MSERLKMLVEVMFSFQTVIEKHKNIKMIKTILKIFFLKLN